MHSKKVRQSFNAQKKPHNFDFCFKSTHRDLTLCFQICCLSLLISPYLKLIYFLESPFYLFHPSLYQELYESIQYTYSGYVHLSFLKRKKRKHISQRKPTQKCTEHYTYTLHSTVQGTFSLIKYKFFRSQKVYYEFMTERTEEMCLSFSYATAEE